MGLQVILAHLIKVVVVADHRQQELLAQVMVVQALVLLLRGKEFFTQAVVVAVSM